MLTHCQDEGKPKAVGTLTHNTSPFNECIKMIGPEFYYKFNNTDNLKSNEWR